jgi:hypothetical protein
VPRCCHRSPRQPTLGADLGVADASTDDIHTAMEWLAGQQDDIEVKLARHLAPGPNPARMALFDLSSSWLKGTRCPLAARGYSRDGKKGRLQIARLLEEQVQAGMTGRRQPQSHHLGGQLGYQRLVRGRGPREKDAQGQPGQRELQQEEQHAPGRDYQGRLQREHQGRHGEQTRENPRLSAPAR